MTQNSKHDSEIKILLVEDNKVNQELAIHMLKILGYTVDAVDDGERALKELDQHIYHMVLMDCEMPVMNGYEATRIWRAREQQQQRKAIPVIALTAHAVSGEREKCLNCGMNDFLTKPFEYDAFAQMVKKWLSDKVEVASSGKVLHEESTEQNVVLTSTMMEYEDDYTLLVLDQEKLNQLCHWQGKPSPELLKKVVNLFLQQMPKLLDEMLDAAQQADVEGTSGIAHTLRSSSATVGANILMSLCKQIELCRDSGKVDMDLVERARPVCAELEVALKLELDKAI